MRCISRNDVVAFPTKATQNEEELRLQQLSNPINESEGIVKETTVCAVSIIKRGVKYNTQIINISSSQAS